MYVNTLISLQENIPTYGVEGKSVTGHVTISTPGIIRCYVQNLKRKSNRRFELYVFSSKKDTGVKIGELSDEKETRWRVDEKSVKESGMNLSEIDGAAIVVIESEMRSLDAILIGFKETRFSILPILEKVTSRRQSKAQNVKAEMYSNINMPQGPGPIISTGQGNKENMPQGPGPVISTGQGNKENMPQGPGPVINTGQGNKENMPQGLGPITNTGQGSIMQEPDPAIGTGQGSIMQEPELAMSTEQENNENIPQEWGTEEEDGVWVIDQEIDSEESWQNPEPIGEGVLDDSEKFSQNENIKKVTDDREKGLETNYNEQVEETKEEIDYLAEIEKKLKDIQSRLKKAHAVSQTDEVKQEKVGKTEEQESSDRDTSTESAIEDILSKMKFFQEKNIKKPFEKEEPLKVNNKRQNNQENLERIYERGEAVEGFIQEKSDTEWVKIPYNDFLGIPGLKYEWCTQPFITFAFYKYNEILMGRNSDGRYYLGIPDIYHPQRKDILKNPVRVDGFLCRKNIAPVVGEYGYWVIPLQ